MTRPMQGGSSSGAPSDDIDLGTPAAGSDPAEAGAPLCEVCGSPMLDRHCKLVCLNCGYMRDCSDP